MKKLLLPFIALAALALAGCSTPASVVTTEIEVSKTDGTLHVSSPKNVLIEGLEATVAQDGTRVVKVARYSAQADPAVADAVKAQYEFAKSSATLAAELAAKAAK